MKYLSILLSFAFLFVMGGMPALHGVTSGKDFGKAVSSYAKADPLGFAGHVSGR